MRPHLLVGILLSLSLIGCSPLVASSDAVSDRAMNGEWPDKLTLEIDHGQRVGEVVNLTPGLLRAGMSRGETDTELRRNGYVPPVSDSAGRNQQPDTTDATPYSRSVSTFPCVYTYTIWISFDSEGGLVKAQGTRRQLACT